MRLPSSFDFAVAGGDDFALLGLFLGGVGDDDPADFLFAFFEALNNDAVVQRSDVHALFSVCREGGSLFPDDLKRAAHGWLALARRDC